MMIGEHQPPPGDKKVGDPHHDQRWRRKVGAEVGEHLLERRNDEHHDDPNDDDRDRDDRDGIEQCGFDLALEGEDLLLVRGKPIEDAVEHAGGLASADEVAVERVEVRRMGAKSLRQAGACLDPSFDVHHQPGKACVAVTAGDNLEALQQRHAGLEHRRELTGEERDVLFGDLAPAAERLPLELGDADALAAQIGPDDVLGRRLHLAAHVAVVAVDAFPGIGVFLDPGVSALGDRSSHNDGIR